MNDLISFSFNDSDEVRHLRLDGKFWFVLSDVCKILRVNNVTQLVQTLDEDEVQTATFSDSGQRREHLLVSEGGLYSIILSGRESRKPGTISHRFRRWVTDVLLPTIRETGRYDPYPRIDWSRVSGRVGTYHAHLGPEPNEILDPLPDPELEQFSQACVGKGFRLSEIRPIVYRACQDPEQREALKTWVLRPGTMLR